MLPSCPLTSEEFASSVQRGSGRAALCLLDNDPSPYLPALLDACVIDHRFTVWIEEGRSRYLLTLAGLAGILPRMEDHLLARLPTLEESWDRKQAWRMLRYLGEWGYPRSKAAVLAYALRDDDGAELVAAWGAAGLRWLLASCPGYFEGEFDHDADWLIHLAEDADGSAAVEAVLPPALREARIAYSQRKPEPTERGAEPTTLIDLIERLKRAKSRSRRRLVRRFGIHAPPEERRALAEAMESMRQPLLLELLANAFRNRPWPLDPAPVVDRTADPKVGWAWRRALGNLEDDRLRTQAWKILESDAPAWDAVELLVPNMRTGEEGRLLNVLERMKGGEPEQIHNVVIDLLQIAERLGSVDMAPPLEWIIENTPCSFCRSRAMAQLAKVGLLNDRYRREAGYDSEADARGLADDALDPRLSPDRFGRAANRGLGRAMLALKTGGHPLYVPELVWIARSSEPVYEVEYDDRAAYLVRLAELAGASGAMIDAILSVRIPEGEDLHGWHATLIHEFARRGDSRAQSVRSEFVRTTSLPAIKLETPPTRDAEELWRRFEATQDRRVRAREAARFGNEASDEALRHWAERMRDEPDPQTVIAMRYAFLHRPWPLPASLVMERVVGDSPDAYAWGTLLRAMPNPDIREFALGRLRQHIPDLNAVGYLRHVYEPGDEKAIFNVLIGLRENHRRTLATLACDLVKIAEVQGAQRFVPHLEWVIDHGPSSTLRRMAIERLLEINALSDFHREEAPYDASLQIRELVKP